ncbi:MAG: proton-conducting transporter membrane subunit [Halobacteriaceae archaeon]
MTGQEQTTTVGQLPASTTDQSRLPTVLTRLAWLLWVLSLGALAGALSTGTPWTGVGLRVDGLTALLWVVATFFSGVVHSYSRRYMAGSRTIDRFFRRLFAFTLLVMILVAADGVVLFGAAWLGMGLVMADLIGHVTRWPQAQAAARRSRRSVLASSALLAASLSTLWWHTGAATISGITSSVATASPAVVLLAASGLLLAAMIQSALFPVHRWLFSSMTAPTPASALMHAGFVNAGGILLVRFGPLVAAEPLFMLVVVLVGAVSALGGKLMKTVRTDVKSALACSTVGQMGFMIMQVGLGFFGAAITHLVLHGFYKAYQFLASGSRVSHDSPTAAPDSDSPGPIDAAVIAVTGLAGGLLFATLTGKGTALDSGLVLTLLVVLTVLQAARTVVPRTGLATVFRYGAVPLVALPAIAVYAGTYRAVTVVLSDLPVVSQPAAFTALHALVAGAFLLAAVAIERGVHRHSQRLYVALLNAGQPPTDTLLTSTEDYNEY